MADTLTSYKLEEALVQSGCPICRLAEQNVMAYLDNLIYEQVNDGKTRAEILAAGGFCRHHGQQLVRQGGALGVAIIHRDLVRQTIELLPGSKFHSPSLLPWVHGLYPVAGSGQELAAALAPEGECPACRRGHEAADLYLRELLAHLEQFRPLFRADNALCLPHFRRLLVFVHGEEALEVLVAWQRTALEALQADLDEFIRKNDYRFSGEPLGEKGDAWQRAVALFSGSDVGE